MMTVYVIMKNGEYMSQNSETGFTRNLGLDCLYMDRRDAVEAAKRITGQVFSLNIDESMFEEL